jgi:hypothetical protein
MSESAKVKNTPEQVKELARLELEQTPPADLEAALQELSRELQVRERCFPRWVTDGRLSKIDAKERLTRQILACKIVSNVLDSLTGGEDTPLQSSAERGEQY